MKNYLNYLVFFLLFSIHSIAQETKNLVDENGLKTGIWLAYHKSGIVKSIENFKEGTMHGPQIYLSDRGYLMTEKNYYNGKAQGEHRQYDVYARMLELITYEEDVKAGLYQKYAPQTYKISEEGFYVDNKKHGKYTWYYDNGNPAAVYHYSFDVIEGEVIFYFKEGGVSTLSNYSAGLQHGVYAEYHENGIIKVEGQFRFGKKTGRWHYYDEQGKKIKSQKH